MEVAVKHQIIKNNPSVVRQEFDENRSLKERDESFQLLRPVSAEELSEKPQPRMN